MIAGIGVPENNHTGDAGRRPARESVAAMSCDNDDDAIP